MPGEYHACITCDGDGAVYGNYLQNGGTVSLWVPRGNLFFDIEITSWQGGAQGGNFGYTRTLVDAPTWDEPEWDDVIAPFVDQITPSVALARDHDGGGLYNAVSLSQWDWETQDGIFWKAGLAVLASTVPASPVMVVARSTAVTSKMGVWSHWIRAACFRLEFSSWTSLEKGIVGLPQGHAMPHLD